MAEDEQEEQQTEEGSETEQPKKKKKWLLLGLILLLLIGLSVAATLYFLGFFATEPEPPAVEEEQAPQEVQAAIYYPLKPEFITNFEVRGRQRFMQVEMTLMLRENDVVPALELHMPAIRNALVMLMRGQSYEELQTPEGKELLRQQALFEIQGVLEQEIGKPGIEQVLFTNLVLQ
ncbi:flagellar basal body-associated FliL family protein [Gilvimarinus sp. DA14]|uniref:flagellar basal body-associated FliL family protein n=1 Tax=Gilvimarinus sp. DA14 TaxID=2956798 RepID=UPI0020B7FE89|nr:flagellar basal body-associated FliL family protein [Gilvimarinus sp. DA14]UTF60787.1 flagellar basal body-associated FliL family protein [Gilvimarinus sp. DA14]